MIIVLSLLLCLLWFSNITFYAQRCATPGMVILTGRSRWGYCETWLASVSQFCTDWESGVIKADIAYRKTIFDLDFRTNGFWKNILTLYIYNIYTIYTTINHTLGCVHLNSSITFFIKYWSEALFLNYTMSVHVNTFVCELTYCL